MKNEKQKIRPSSKNTVKVLLIVTFKKINILIKVCLNKITKRECRVYL